MLLRRSYNQLVGIIDFPKHVPVSGEVSKKGELLGVGEAKYFFGFASSCVAELLSPMETAQFEGRLRRIDSDRRFRRKEYLSFIKHQALYTQNIRVDDQVEPLLGIGLIPLLVDLMKDTGDVVFRQLLFALFGHDRVDSLLLKAGARRLLLFEDGFGFFDFDFEFVHAHRVVSMALLQIEWLKRAKVSLMTLALGLLILPFKLQILLHLNQIHFLSISMDSLILRTAVNNILKALQDEKSGYRSQLQKFFEQKFPSVYKYPEKIVQGNICLQCKKQLETFLILVLHDYMFHYRKHNCFKICQSYIQVFQGHFEGKQTQNKHIFNSPADAKKSIILSFIRMLRDRIYYDSPTQFKFLQQTKKTVVAKIRLQQKERNDKAVKILSGLTLYHSQDPYRMVQQKELLQESEEEFQQQIYDDLDDKLISQFDDIGPHQKQLFVLWNKFIKNIKFPRPNHFRKFPASPVPCLKDFFRYVQTFVQTHREQLRRLKPSFVMHLNTLFCHGLLSRLDMIRLLMRLQKKDSLIERK